MPKRKKARSKTSESYAKLATNGKRRGRKPNLVFPIETGRWPVKQFETPKIVVDAIKSIHHMAPNSDQFIRVPHNRSDGMSLMGVIGRIRRELKKHGNIALYVSLQGPKDKPNMAYIWRRN